MSARAFEHVTLDQLEIEDAAAFKHVALFEELRDVLIDAKYTFRVPAQGTLAWDRAVFLNLAYWSDGDGGGDVLVERSLPADVVMHVAWHHLAAARLGPSEDAELFGESIASAFDLYLVGRLLGRGATSSFLDSQVPAMSDAAEAAGLDEAGMEQLLGDVAADPDRAFEDLRVLLFDTTRDLCRAADADAAMSVLEARRDHRFAPLLHHYELALWVANARARRALRQSAAAALPGPTVADVHGALARAPSSVEWLRENWVIERPSAGAVRGE